MEIINLKESGGIWKSLEEGREGNNDVIVLWSQKIK